MPSPNDFPARGHVLEVAEGHLVFAPTGFRYQLQLQTKSRFGGNSKAPVSGLVRGIARQLWTIPAGGNFVSPIFGSPRTVQGRLKYVSDTEIVVQAGMPIVLQLPHNDVSIDLTNGPLVVGAMINAMVMPGMEFQPLQTLTAASVAPAATGAAPAAVAGDSN
jgi:heme/copper-type cytochrome/quinol oxidase subunit 2